MRLALFIVLMLVPANASCAALPMDGSLLKKVTKQEMKSSISREAEGFVERAPEIRAIAEGESCRCEAVCS